MNNTINKIQEGNFYRYKGQTVRLNKRVGIMGILSRRKDVGFIGRVDLLRPAKTTHVAKFLR
jgi:hypothetical protein